MTAVIRRRRMSRKSLTFWRPGCRTLENWQTWGHIKSVTVNLWEPHGDLSEAGLRDADARVVLSKPA